MKKKIYRLAAIAVGVMLCSCSMLDKEPTIITKFYNSPEEVKYGLAAVYGPMALSDFYGNGYSLTIANADDLCYANRDIVVRPDYYNHSAGDATNTQAWGAIYQGVKNANEFMTAVANSKHDPDHICYAEAKFLRAYYHFILAQTWGDVPLRSSATQLPTQTALAATPQSDVLKWCVAEMQDCLQYLEEDHLKITPSRVTRSTVEGILARVYLFMAGVTVKDVDKTEMYTQAAFWAGEVITRNNHTLNPDYKQVFINMISNKYDIENHESMWEVEFLGDRSSDREWSNGRIGDNIGLQSQNSNDVNYSEWNCNYAYALYNGSIKLWYLYWNTDRTEDQDGLETALDTRLDWNLPTYNYIGNTNKGYRGGYDKTPYYQSSVSTFDNMKVAAGIRNAGKWRRETIYESNVGIKQNFTKVNFPLLRYSDVLLMYAEAVNELNGPTQEAYDCVKKVRDRAQIKTKPFSEYADPSTLRELVRNERARELAFEGIRKFDLIRWGTFVAEMQRYNDYVTDPNWGVGVNGGRLYNNPKTLAGNVKPKHIYMPIPTRELSDNSLMKQNPLW